RSVTERQRTCAAAITRWLTTSTRYGLKASGRTAVALPQGFVAHKGFLATRLRATPVVLYKDIGLHDPPLRLTHNDPCGSPCGSTLPPRSPPVISESGSRTACRMPERGKTGTLTVSHLLTYGCAVVLTRRISH